MNMNWSVRHLPYVLATLGLVTASIALVSFSAGQLYERRFTTPVSSGTCVIPTTTPQSWHSLATQDYTLEYPPFWSHSASLPGIVRLAPLYPTILIIRNTSQPTRDPFPPTYSTESFTVDGYTGRRGHATGDVTEDMVVLPSPHGGTLTLTLSGATPETEQLFNRMLTTLHMQ